MSNFNLQCLKLRQMYQKVTRPKEVFCEGVCTNPVLIIFLTFYSRQVAMCLNKLLRFTADSEMQMNPVERVQYYTQLLNENNEGKYIKVLHIYLPV